MFKSLLKLHPLLLTVLVVDLLTPILIWKNIIPSSTRWLSHLAIVLMAGLVIAHVLRFGRLPALVLGLFALACGTALIAIFRGQSLIATAWGGWVTFQFPMIGVFAYFTNKWPKNFPTLLTNFCAATLVFELVVQLGQYALGQIPGDDLGGTFGQHGTGSLMLFMSLTVCFCMGRYLNIGRWQLLAAMVAVAAVSSTLGEIKMFVLALVLLAMLNVLITAVRDRQFGRVIMHGALAATAIISFFVLYNAIVVASSGTLQSRGGLETFLDKNRVERYLGGVRRERSHKGTYTYNMGRNYALVFGWKAIQRDALTFLCGYGLGARHESESLQIKGAGLAEGGRGMSGGTGMTVIVQEFGVIGVGLVAIMALSVIAALTNQIRQHQNSKVNELRYGLLIFTAMWPVWQWYNLALTMRVPMLIYFMALGYVLSVPEDNPQADDELYFQPDGAAAEGVSLP